MATRPKAIRRLRVWLEEQSEAFEGETFPPDVQAAWNQNVEELLDQQQTLINLEERLRCIREASRRNRKLRRLTDKRISGSGPDWVSI
jgi:hypothetical protein